MRGDPSTSGDVIKRLRGMLGHLGRRDKDAVLTAIDAIEELTVRLHEATHVPVPEGRAFSLKTIPDDDVTGLVGEPEVVNWPKHVGRTAAEKVLD